MAAELVCLAALVCGVDFGWQPAPKGGVEYLIQIEPEAVQSLLKGEAFGSDLPPEIQGKDVRSFRITVRNEALPQRLPPTDAAPLVPPPSAQQAAFVQPEQPTKNETPAEETPSRPWYALILVTLVLAASLGANGYQGWMLFDARKRFRALLGRVEPNA